jgi:hypothetical protein
VVVKRVCRSKKGLRTVLVQGRDMKSYQYFCFTATCEQRIYKLSNERNKIEAKDLIMHWTVRARCNDRVRASA